MKWIFMMFNRLSHFVGWLLITFLVLGSPAVYGTNYVVTGTNVIASSPPGLPVGYPPFAPPLTILAGDGVMVTGTLSALTSGNTVQVDQGTSITNNGTISNSAPGVLISTPSGGPFGP